MDIIYANTNNIYNFGSCDNIFNEYIKPENIKNISYGCDEIAILSKDNKILIFNIKNIISFKHEIIFDKNIRYICYKWDKLIILTELSELYINISDNMNPDFMFIIYDPDIRYIDKFSYSVLIFKLNEIWRLVNIKYIHNDLFNFMKESDLKSDYNRFKILEHEYCIVKLNFNIVFDHYYCGKSYIILQNNNNLYRIYDNKINKLNINIDNNIISKLCCMDDELIILTKLKRIWIYKFNDDNLFLYTKNIPIFDIWNIKDNIIILDDNGVLYKLIKDCNFFNNIILTIDPTLIFVANSIVKLKWNTTNHINYPDDIKQIIFNTLLILNFIQSKHKIKIPKYLKYIIINFLL